MLLALWLVGTALSAAPCTAYGLLPRSQGIVRLATAFAAAPHLRSHSRRSCGPVMMAKKGKSSKGKPPPVSKGFGAAKDPPLIEMGKRLAKNMGKGGSSSLNPKVCNDEWLLHSNGSVFSFVQQQLPLRASRLASISQPHFLRTSGGLHLPCCHCCCCRVIGL